MAVGMSLVIVAWGYVGRVVGHRRASSSGEALANFFRASNKPTDPARRQSLAAALVSLLILEGQLGRELGLQARRHQEG